MLIATDVNLQSTISHDIVLEIMSISHDVTSRTSEICAGRETTFLYVLLPWYDFLATLLLKLMTSYTWHGSHNSVLYYYSIVV